MPWRSAKAAARDRDRDPTATSSAPGTWAKSGATLSAIRPGPAIPHRTGADPVGLLKVALLPVEGQSTVVRDADHFLCAGSDRADLALLLIDLSGREEHGTDHRQRYL